MTDAKKGGRKLVPNDPELDDAEKTAIKAVRAYEAATKTLDLFRIENGEMFKIYDELVEEQEQKRQVADAAMRATDASFGPWNRFSERKTYDTTMLYESIGEAKFLEIGGRLNKVTTYEIDPKQIEVAAAARKIPARVMEEVRKVVPSYRAPKPPGKS